MPHNVADFNLGAGTTTREINEISHAIDYLDQNSYASSFYRQRVAFVLDHCEEALDLVQPGAVSRTEVHVPMRPATGMGTGKVVLINASKPVVDAAERTGTHVVTKTSERRSMKRLRHLPTVACPGFSRPPIELLASPSAPLRTVLARARCPTGDEQLRANKVNSRAPHCSAPVRSAVCLLPSQCLQPHDATGSSAFSLFEQEHAVRSPAQVAWPCLRP